MNKGMKSLKWYWWENDWVRRLHYITAVLEHTETALVRMDYIMNEWLDEWMNKGMKSLKRYWWENDWVRRLHGIIRDVRSYKDFVESRGIMKKYNFFITNNSYLKQKSENSYLFELNLFMALFDKYAPFCDDLHHIIIIVYTLSIKSSSPLFLGTYTVNISNISRSS